MSRRGLASLESFVQVNLAMYEISVLMRMLGYGAPPLSAVLERRISDRLEELVEERYRLELALAVLKTE